ncbi:MAG: beta-ketoacyl synthase N-terminal-like domain-containing protein [Bacteroidota bacterium]
MPRVFLSHNTILSSYGFTSKSAISQIEHEVSGLQLIQDERLLSTPFYSSRIDRVTLDGRFHKLQLDPSGFAHTPIKDKQPYTPLEKILICSLADTLQQSGISLTERVGLIISTTKGNIDVLEADSVFPQERAYLPVLGKSITSFFGFKNDAIVLSNACVSGILAVAVAKGLILQGKYDHVFVVAGDLVSRFILSGFQAFQALSKEPCRPYCKTRSGINIGEVGASILVTQDPNHLIEESVALIGEATCNDANHISGPSRTGEGLYRSVIRALEQAGVSASQIDYISAHGTATPFNDEMEAKAFNRVGLQHTPLNSLKGYFGHTLGASGLLETIIGMHALQKNTLFASKGFQELGVSEPLNIIKGTTPRKMTLFLKTASGFGGCNTAAIFQKIGQ